MRTFVIVVDAQYDFMCPDGALPVPGADAMIAPMDRWLGALAPEDTAGVLATFDTHVPEIYAISEEAAQFPPHCVRDTPGWRSVLNLDALDAAIPLYRLEKGVFDMWAEPGVAIEPVRPPAAAVARDAFFARLLEDDVATVTVIGVAADFCVRWAIDGLIARGFAVTVPAALTRGIERQIDAVKAEEFVAASVRLI